MGIKTALVLAYKSQNKGKYLKSQIGYSTSKSNSHFRLDGLETGNFFDEVKK